MKIDETFRSLCFFFFFLVFQCFIYFSCKVKIYDRIIRLFVTLNRKKASMEIKSNVHENGNKHGPAHCERVT